MGPFDASTVSDRESETSGARRGRPPFPRELVLAAADALFADAEAPAAVSMDDVAAAAGVGKGTLFRAFGSRDGLLDALFAARLAPLRDAVESDEPPLGTGAPPRERILALLDAVLTFKLGNHHLTHAREVAGAGLLQAGHYRWLHSTIRGLIQEAAPEAATADPGYPDYTAHVLLGALRVDLIDELLATGHTPQQIQRAQAALARRVLAAEVSATAD
jgi:AcrR family transcriptional regulator